MRAKEGLWAAVGAGTALAVAGLLVLASVSVVLAVHGWPQVGGAGGDRSVALHAQVAAAERETRTTALRDAIALPVRRSAAPRTATHRAAGGRRPSVRGRRPAASRPGISGPAPAATQPAGSSPSPTARSPAAAGPVRPVTNTVGTTVTDVTDAAGGALSPVSPQVADTVTATGQQVGATVDKVGATVGGGVVGGG